MPPPSHHPGEPIDPDLDPADRSEPAVGRLRRTHPAAASTGPRRAQPSLLGAIAAGGMLGASARYGLSRVIHVAPETFPWATFFTNVAGSFALGLGLVLLLERAVAARHLRAFFATGVVGAFTTMSTFEVETVTLFKDGHPALAVIYGAVSVVAGVGAALAGIRLARLGVLRRGGPGAGGSGDTTGATVPLPGGAGTGAPS